MTIAASVTMVIHMLECCMRVLESFQYSAVDDDVTDADAGDDAEEYASDRMGVEGRAFRRAHVAWLHCVSVEENERVVRMRGAMW